MTSTPVRAIQSDEPLPEAYSLEAVGKHGFGKCACLSACTCAKVKFFLTTNLFVYSVRCHNLFPSAAIEVGPQPNGVLRADIFNVVKEALALTVEWLQEFNSGKKQPFKCVKGSHATLYRCSPIAPCSSLRPGLITQYSNPFVSQIGS